MTTPTITFDDLVLVDVYTASERLSVSVARVKELIRNERLAAVMHGGRYLVAEEEINNYLDRLRCAERSHRQTPGKPFLPPPRDPDQHVLWS